MKYLKNIVVLMAGCMSLVSCEDKLTEKPNSYYTEDEFFSDPDNVEMGILGIYNVLPSLYGDYGMAFFASDDTWYASTGNSDSGRRDISAYTMTTSNRYVENAWTYTYQGLERANYMIAGIEAMDEYESNENLHELVAEAKFLRALFSFNLVLYWGDVPYKTTPTNSYEEAYLPRTSREDIYDQIIEDLTDAEEGMDWATSSSSPERATQASARALKMRVLLQRAGYSLQMDGTLQRPEDNLRQEYFTAVTEEWEAFEANGYHGLYTTDNGVSNGFDDDHTIGNYEALFRTFSYGTLNSRESLFEVAFYTVDGSTGARGYWGTYNGPRVDAPGINTTETSDFMGRANAMYRVVPEWRDFFEEGDNRRDVMVCTYNYTWDSDVYNHVKEEVTDVRSWYPGKWRREWMPIGYKEPNITDVNYCMLRYADVVLMAAEAYNELGETSTAWTLLNRVRERAQATQVNSLQEYRNCQPNLLELPFFNGGTAQDDFRAALYWERAFELAFEGMRKYDLIRWGILEEALVMTGNNTHANTAGTNRPYVAGDNFQTGKHELFPIPLDEIQANPLLENKNNPNY